MFVFLSDNVLRLADNIAIGVTPDTFKHNGIVEIRKVVPFSFAKFPSNPTLKGLTTPFGWQVRTRMEWVASAFQTINKKFLAAKSFVRVFHGSSVLDFAKAKRIRGEIINGRLIINSEDVHALALENQKKMARVLGMEVTP